MGRVPTENVTSQGKTPNNLLYIDTNNFNGIQGFPTWNEIYRIFVNEYISRPIFPYNDAVKWVYLHLESNNATIVNDTQTLSPHYIQMTSIKGTSCKNLMHI
jgi:hypothetical protein